MDLGCSQRRKKLYNTSTKLLSEGLDKQMRKSLEAYQDVLQDKLKHHHGNLCFTSDCMIPLEEKKRACVTHGPLSKQHQDLVTTLFQTLPTIGESFQETPNEKPTEPSHAAAGLDEQNCCTEIVEVI